MSKVLNQLIEFNNKNKKIKFKNSSNEVIDSLHDSKFIELDEVFDRGMAVKLDGYKDGSVEYPLDTLITATQLRDVPFIDYMKQSKELSVSFISALDRKGVVDYLLNKSDNKTHDQPSTASKKRYTTNTHDRDIVKRIKSKEIDLDDRVSVLRGSKVTLFSSLQQQIAQKLESYNRPTKQPQPTRNKALKPKNMSPIIIISSSPTSVITMYNVKQFLSQATFVPSNAAKEAAKESNQSIDDLITIYRPKSNDQQSKWYVINSVETLNKFGPDAWQRVVCVITTGQLWQFKLYKWSDPRNLFRNVKGVYLHYSNESINSNIKDWNVSTFAIDKDKRHTDKSLVSNFWRQLDSWIATNKPYLTV